MIKKLLHSKIMIFILALFLVALPATINRPDQTQQFSIVLGVGIDKSDEGYEVSTQILTSKANQGFLESLQVHSTKGKNILDAVEKLSLHIGRIAGFGNNSVIVMSQEVSTEDVGSTLDFFLRSKRLNGNPVIIVTENKAKDILSDVAKIDESFNYSLNSVAQLNDAFAAGAMCTLEQFLDNYYGGRTSSIVGVVKETNNIDDGIEIPPGNGSSDSSGANQSGGQSGGGNGGSSSGESEQKVLSNDGSGAIFKNGKLVTIVDSDAIEGINILTGSNRNVYTIENVNDEIYHNATVVLSVRNKVKTKQSKFSKNGIPRIYYNINYTIKVEQIIQNGNDRIVLDGSKNYVSPELEKRFKQEVSRIVSSSINIAKAYNVDVYDAQMTLYRHHLKQWKNYIKSLPNKDDAFKNIEFFLNIIVKGNL